MEAGVALPRVEIQQKVLILLSGFNEEQAKVRVHADAVLEVYALEQLRDAAERNEDAVAFGFVKGQWRPAA